MPLYTLALSAFETLSWLPKRWQTLSPTTQRYAAALVVSSQKPYPQAFHQQWTTLCFLLKLCCLREITMSRVLHAAPIACFNLLPLEFGAEAVKCWPSGADHTESVGQRDYPHRAAPSGRPW